MRTIIFIFGVEFLDLLSKHWNIPNELPKNVIAFMSFVLLGCIVLDIVEIFLRRYII